MADNNPSEAVPEEPGTSSPEGEENVTPSAEEKSGADAGQAKGMTLDEINTMTGRNYKTLEDAQKGIKETYNYVGEAGKKTDAAVDPDKFMTREEFQAKEFFRDNPEHAKNKDLINELSKSQGLPPDKVVETELYKSTAARLSVADKVEDTRSTITSNPRLGIVKDTAQKASDAMEAAEKARASGDTIGEAKLRREAETNAVKAVADAYGIEGAVS